MSEAGRATAGSPPDRPETGLVPIPVRRGTPSTPAADVEGVDLAGQPARLPVVGTGHPTLLLFLSSTCWGCAPVWDEVAAGWPGLPSDVVVAVVTHDDAAGAGPARPARRRTRWRAGAGRLAGREAGSGARLRRPVRYGTDDRSVLRRMHRGAVPVVMSSEAWRHYGVAGPPFFVLVDGTRDLVVAESVVSGPPQITAEVVGALGAVVPGGETGDSG